MTTPVDPTDPLLPNPDVDPTPSPDPDPGGQLIPDSIDPPRPV
ncbi:MAG: hypothetical protein JWN61_2214 [Pseudonocardiales bacterium]|nr:hypothetical protein [Pseudonocardiales bacterium]